MVQIVLLIGRGNSGKTETLKKFFGIHRRLRRYEYIEKSINGNVVCAVSLSSPQELMKEIAFCDYDLVINNIKKRLNMAKREVKKRHNTDDFIFVMPFGLYLRRDGRTNEDCILKPIEQLKKDGHTVLPIYLKKASKNPFFDKFMNGLTSNEISSRKDYDKQAEELEKLIFS